ncbi:MAG: hypothetical protein O3C23_01090 [bacterium]|nr:hypothetical protein [bacterium]
MKANILRKKHPIFFYKGYDYTVSGGNLHISFDFEISNNISFHPTVVIKNIPKKYPDIENLVFHLGLVEMISYWKLTASPQIVIEAGHLNAKQIAWLTDLIFQGMGEYFFENKLNYTKKDFLSIVSAGVMPKLSLGAPKLSLGNRVLVPIGGGKDAAVTLELLKKAKVPLRPFLLNPKKEQLGIIAQAKAQKPIVVERTIDPKLLKLNRKGYLNGHTPFSAYLAFLATLAAVLFDLKYIALSNERSSNEGNVKYLGKTINHQYSKSYDFEKKFRQYSKEYLSRNVEYFSFLRPLYELQIAKLFSGFKKYFPVFLSCNEAHKTKSGSKKPTGVWCGACAKCLFVFIMLYPFAGEKQTVNIFKKNLLKDAKLKPFLDELTGKKRFKPFECVGTIKETRVALALQGKKDHPMLHAWNAKHFIPKKFEKILKSAISLCYCNDH